MSYDIWISCAHCDSELEPSTNYTHNVGPMLHDAGIDWNGKMNNLPVSEALPILEAGISKLESNPEYYRSMNPENGWGSYDGMMEWLAVIRKQMKAHPEGVVRVC